MHRQLNLRSQMESAKSSDGRAGGSRLIPFIFETIYELPAGQPERYETTMNRRIRRRRPKKPIPPISTGELKTDTAINVELALYNRTGNMLALWAAFGLCARSKSPLPDEMIARIGEIADKLLKYAVDDVPRARELIADEVLGTKNESGGPSPFRAYRLAKRHAEIVARVFALLVQDQEDLQDHKKTRPGSGKSKKDASRTRTKARATSKAGTPPPTLTAIKSHTDIYKQVAKEFRVAAETVKRLFEQDDRNAGPFSYRVIRENRDKGGIIDI
jgi:hypothetical protein